jgi:alpha-L-fucosidase
MRYQPNLQSVKTHSLPGWYNDAKFGIFIHWGLYSIPAFAPPTQDFAEKLFQGEVAFSASPYAEWYQNSLRLKGSATAQYHVQTYGAEFHYEQFAPLFNAQIQKWDPNAWANLFAGAGARYVVLVSKHHDGFLMWNSRHANPRLAKWQAARDIAGELTQAVNARGMKMGFYYSSLLDWSFTPRPISSLAELVASSDTSREYLDYVDAHWRELIERYDPWILWSDIGYPPGCELPKLWADFYNRKPEGVINDRWLQLPRFFFTRLGRFILTKILERMGKGEPPKPAHCDFVTPEYATRDHIAEQKWETCRGIGNSFGYNQFEGADDYQKAVDLIRLLVDIVSKNGNLLLNVGPRADGSIHPLQVEALEGLGAWLKKNGEAIYGTRPWKRFNEPGAGEADIRYTAKSGALYAILTKIPANRLLDLPPDAAQGAVTLLETGEELQVERSGPKLRVTLPGKFTENAIPVIKIAPPAAG